MPTALIIEAQPIPERHAARYRRIYAIGSWDGSVTRHEAYGPAVLSFKDSRNQPPIREGQSAMTTARPDPEAKRWVAKDRIAPSDTPNPQELVIPVRDPLSRRAVLTVGPRHLPADGWARVWLDTGSGPGIVCRVRSDRLTLADTDDGEGESAIYNLEPPGEDDEGGTTLPLPA